MKKATTAFAVISVTLIAFGVYSSAVTFENWPWTVRSDATDESIAGFVAGSDKAAVLDQAIAGRKAGLIRGMMPAGQPPGGGDERLSGSDLSTDDLERFVAYDQWVVGLTDADKYLDLRFSDDRLATITLREYRGPHE